VDVSYHYKYYLGNFREIINLKKVDVCALMDNVKRFPLFVDAVKAYEAIYPGLLHKCPYTGVSSQCRI
jgi:hypothetical protein